MQSPTTNTKGKQRVNRNFIDTLNARMAKKLNEKSQRWCYDFATETPIVLSTENQQFDSKISDQSQQIIVPEQNLHISLPSKP